METNIRVLISVSVVLINDVIVSGKPDPGPQVAAVCCSLSPDWSTGSSLRGSGGLWSSEQMVTFDPPVQPEI